MQLFKLRENRKSLECAKFILYLKFQLCPLLQCCHVILDEEVLIVRTFKMEEGTYSRERQWGVLLNVCVHSHMPKRVFICQYLHTHHHIKLSWIQIFTSWPSITWALVQENFSEQYKKMDGTSDTLRQRVLRSLVTKSRTFALSYAFQKLAFFHST